MTIRDWARDTKSRVQIDGLSGAVESAHELRIGGIRLLAQFRHSPTPIWEREWDVLVVLDACRYDLLREVEDEYEFLTVGETTESVASSTVGWVETTFSTEYEERLSRTAYVTGNPNSVRALPYRFPAACECGTELSPAYRDVYHIGETTCESCGSTVTGDRRDPFAHLSEVWRDHWDNELGTILPRPITDSAITLARNHAPDRLIVHYMQPHHPFVGATDIESGTRIADGDRKRTKLSRTVWEQLQDRELSRARVWDGYRNNLRVVLDDIEVLLDNLDAATVAITSDHGNALGEHGLFGHPPKTPVSCLVTVPWYVTTASDERSHRPAATEDDSVTRVPSEEVERRLEDLGYR